MNSKVQLLGLDEETATRYARVIKGQGITSIEVIADLELAKNCFSIESGIVILGYSSTNASCTEILEVLRKDYPQVNVVLITENSDLSTVVDALRYGALDHIVKGEWDEVHIEAAVQRSIRIKDILNADRGELWKQISGRIHAA